MDPDRVSSGQKPVLDRPSASPQDQRSRPSRGQESSVRLPPELLSVLLPPSPPSLERSGAFENEEDYWALAGYSIDLKQRLFEIRERLRDEALKGSSSFHRSPDPFSGLTAAFQGNSAGQSHLAQLSHRVQSALRVTSKVRYTLRSTATDQDSSGPDADFGLLVERASTLARAAATASDALERRWIATPAVYPGPRLLRLAAREGLSRSEVRLLELLVCSGSDPKFARQRRFWDQLEDIACILEFDGPTVFELLDSHSPLQRLELVHIEQDLLGVPFHRKARMELPVVRILRGYSLRPDEHLPVAEECLRALLAEEGFSARASTSGGSEASTLEDPAVRRVELELSDGVDLSVQEPTLEASEAPRSFSDLAEPYGSDLEYLEEFGQWFRLRFDLKDRALKGSWRPAVREGDREARLEQREVLARERRLGVRIEHRREATRLAGGRRLRAEELRERYQLSRFEADVLVLLAVRQLSPEMSSLDSSPNVRDLCFFFFDRLEAQIAAKASFLNHSPLVREGLVHLNRTGFESDAGDASVAADPRITAFLTGLEAETSELAEGSYLFRPTVDLDSVILPDSEKRAIIEAVESFPRLSRLRASGELGPMLTGGGLALLFHGPSGTGKTMMAHALAAHQGKKILQANWADGDDRLLRFLFREAKIQDAVPFFDECDGLFEQRAKGNRAISLLLTEIERFDGLVLLATNRPQELDEAMDRRFLFKVRFRPPTAALREAIWRAHLPASVPVDGDLDLPSLARSYELTGGLIKNAVVAALSAAVVRAPERPSICQKDLEEGSRHQLISALERNRLEDRIVPRLGLASLVVDADTRARLEAFVDSEKTRRTLFAEWGFDPAVVGPVSNVALFHGPPGTGKTLAAEAIAWELGRVVKRVNVESVVSKWVGEGAKNLRALFRDVEEHEAVLLFDEADALFATRTNVMAATDRYANLEVAVLLRELESFQGVAILTTNLRDHLDAAFLRRVSRHVEFRPPNAALRRDLWRRHIPSGAPAASSLDLELLAQTFPLTGAEIRSAVVRAFSRASRDSTGNPTVDTAALEAAAREELGSKGAPRYIGFQGEANTRESS